MPINYIPNDPLAQAAPPIRQKEPRPNRGPGVAGFTFVDAQPQGVGVPGTPQFLFWQCREAALAAVEAWEAVDGPVTQWARATPDRKKLALRPNEGIDLNAFYDGQSLSFFEFTSPGKTTFSGASTDVVAHEAGHALLDRIRPDLWGATFVEAGAFHEAFGDCLALLTALTDQQTRQALLAASPNLATANFLEATAEDLSDGVRIALGPQHPAAAPRHALNTFRWQLPSSLPTNGPPNVLTSEVHSFGRIFSGCFYDTVRNIFMAMPNRNEVAVATAATTAAKLLIAGARGAPAGTRLFRAVGRAMILADQQQNNGANRMAIHDAFARHNIALGSAAMLAPTAGLAGAPPRMAAAPSAVLTPTTRRDLLRRLDAAPRARLDVDVVNVGGEDVAHAVHYREVPLDDVDNRLRGVIALAPEPVLVGASGNRAAVLGALPTPSVTTDEVQTFVRTLMANGNIEMGTGRTAAVAAPRTAGSPTHVIETRGRRRILTRVRFV
jgi:hypothetical protein